MNFKHRETEKQILPKISCRAFLSQIAVSCRDEAKTRSPRLGVAHRSDFLLLQHA